MLKLPPKAQASIEYMTIAVLVVTGIVLMGPYVLRSINAHFKSMDDQVQDSFQEEMAQAPDEDFNLDGCSCSEWQQGTCGTNGCDRFATHYYKTCGPSLGCETQFPEVGPISECRPDVSCCTPWENTGCVPISECPNPVAGTSGALLQTRTCAPGNTDVTEQCAALASCNFICSGRLPANTELCCDPAGPDCEFDDVNLPADLPYQLVSAGGCTDATKCELQCRAGFSRYFNVCVCDDAKAQWPDKSLFISQDPLYPDYLKYFELFDDHPLITGECAGAKVCTYNPDLTKNFFFMNWHDVRPPNRINAEVNGSNGNNNIYNNYTYPGRVIPGSQDPGGYTVVPFPDDTMELLTITNDPLGSYARVRMEHHAAGFGIAHFAIMDADTPTPNAVFTFGPAQINDQMDIVFTHYGLCHCPNYGPHEETDLRNNTEIECDPLNSPNPQSVVSGTKSDSEGDERSINAIQCQYAPDSDLGDNKIIINRSPGIGKCPVDCTAGSICPGGAACANEKCPTGDCPSGISCTPDSDPDTKPCPGSVDCPPYANCTPGQKTCPGNATCPANGICVVSECPSTLACADGDYCPMLCPDGYIVTGMVKTSPGSDTYIKSITCRKLLNESMNFIGPTQTMDIRNGRQLVRYCPAGSVLTGVEIGTQGPDTDKYEKYLHCRELACYSCYNVNFTGSTASTGDTFNQTSGPSPWKVPQDADLYMAVDGGCGTDCSVYQGDLGIPGNSPWTSMCNCANNGSCAAVWDHVPVFNGPVDSGLVPFTAGVDGVVGPLTICDTSVSLGVNKLSCPLRPDSP